MVSNLIMTFLLQAQNSKDIVSDSGIVYGLGFGGALAMVICWSRTESILTTIIAGLLGWFYVIYFIIVRNNEKN